MEQSKTSDNDGARIDRDRAAYAYTQVSQIPDRRSAQDYRSLALNLSVRVLQNGLGQTVAFLMSKAEGKQNNAHGILLRQISDWLNNKSIIVSDRNVSPNERLMKALLDEKTSREKWLIAQEETIALGLWLKRFAEALIPKDKSTDKAGEEKQ